MRLSKIPLGLIAPLTAILSTTAAAMPIDFDCDVPANHFSSLKADLLGPSEISGTIIAVEFRSGKNLPVAGARIFNDGDDTSAGFQLIAPSSRSSQLEVVINGKKDGDLKRYTVGRTSTDTPISFRLILADDGNARLEIGSNSFDIPADPIRTGKAMVFCSTGQFKFSALKLADKQAATGTPPPNQNSRVSE